MEKLTRNGQAILCTVHQPSSLLFQRFDRLLLLAKGGRTVYFGDIGKNSEVLLDYFKRNGGPDCSPGTNPAEYMLEAIGAAPGAQTSIDWPQVWKDSREYQEVQTELARLRELANRPSAVMDSTDSSYQAFAAPFMTQLRAVGLRVAQQYWRTPAYIYAKALLSVGCSFLIGFSFFKTTNTQQGLQNQMFAVFIFLFVVTQLVMQIMPMFITQRTLYEARERQSKTYAWQAFVLSNIGVELAWNAVSTSTFGKAILMRLTSTTVHGNPLFPRLVLSRCTLSQRSTHRFGRHSRFPHLTPSRPRVPVCIVTSPHVDRRVSQRRSRRCFRNPDIDYALRFLRNSRRSRQTPRVLGLHVPRQPLHVPGFKFHGSYSWPSTRILRRHRIPGLQSRC